MKFTMGDRNSWPGKVLRAFDKYWQMKLPVPADPVMYVYRAAWSNADWLAMRHLKQSKPSVIEHETSFDLYWTDDVSGNGNCPHVSFAFPNGQQMPAMGVKLTELPETTQKVFRNWIVSVNYYRAMRNDLEARCRGVMGCPSGSWRTADLYEGCNTPGQLYRIWPEIQPLMEPDWKHRVTQSAARSPAPKTVWYPFHRPMRESRQFSTPEEFRCEDMAATAYDKERFRELNEIILLVSLADKLEANHSYPNFHGPLNP